MQDDACREQLRKIILSLECKLRLRLQAKPALPAPLLLKQN